MNILAIETSCDETAAAVVKNGREVLSSIVASQIDLHKKYDGVVPEVAARAHVQAVIPIVKEALSEAFPSPVIPAQAGIHKKKSSWDQIDAIAVTQGPGLIGSLIVGTETARTLAILKNKPLISINHLEGHIYANWIREQKNKKTKKQKNSSLVPQSVCSSVPQFPLVALLVSGGHTLLVHMSAHHKFEIVGATRDDAAGEAFDKVATLLGLPYPGGPNIHKLAQKGDKNKHKFPIVDLTPEPKRGSDGFLEYPEPSLDFSFSGLKTAVLGEVRSHRHSREGGNLSSKEKADIAASFQKTLVDTLTQNSQRVIERYKPRSFMLSGGVAANKELRTKLEDLCKKLGIDFYMPGLAYCTDNAAMIGAAAYYKQKEFGFAEPKSFTPDPNLKLK